MHSNRLKKILGAIAISCFGASSTKAAIIDRITTSPGHVTLVCDGYDCEQYHSILPTDFVYTIDHPYGVHTDTGPTPDPDDPNTPPPTTSGSRKDGNEYTTGQYSNIKFWGLTCEKVPCDDPLQQCMNTYTASVQCMNTDTCQTATGTGEGSAVLNDQEAADKAIAAAESDCAAKVGGTSSTTSLVDNFTFNHHHFAQDWVFASTGAGTGCASCGGGSASAVGYGTLEVKRTQSLRESTQPSSFGTGHFLSYDVSLTLFEVNGTTYIDCFNPAWLGTRRYAPSGLSFRDTIYNSVKAVNLYDAAGNPTTSRQRAVRAVYIGRGGEQIHFELFTLDANRTGGRMTGTALASGDPVLRFEYAVATDDTTALPESKWLKSRASDPYGNTLNFTYATLATGATAISELNVSGGVKLTYSYDDGGNIIAANYPNGDRSTYVRSVEGNLLKLAFHEAGEKGVHRNKTGYYSNNIAASLLNWDNNSRPIMYNQSSQLVRKFVNAQGELTYWAASGGNGTGGTMHRKVYEGGGRLRFFDTAERSSYSKWMAPESISATDPFGSIAVTKEKYGNWSPWWQYAENRSGRPVQVTKPESPVHYYLYDGNGNRRLARLGDKARRSAFDARFNKPVFSVDYSGNASLATYDNGGHPVSRKTGWVFDKGMGAGAELSGLRCAYYENVDTLEALDTATPVSVQQADTVALGQRETLASKWGMRFEGKLILASDGERTFNLSADDRCRLYLDGALVTDVAYNQGTKTAKVNLTAGAHDIRVDFVEFGGGQRLDLTWSGPETTDASGVAAKTIIGSNYLAHATTADELTLRPTDAATEEKWEYFPSGGPLAGLMKAHVDAAGKRTEYAYDSYSRPVQVKETGDNGDLVVTQTRTYDAAGNLASSADALGRTVRYAYDARNRLVKTVYGDDTTETVTYGSGDNANLVVARKDRAGSVTKYEYDAAGRCVRTLYGYALADNDGGITQVLEKPSVETSTYLDGTEDAIRTVRDGKVTEYDYDYKGRVVATRTFPSNEVMLSALSQYSADEVLFSTTDAHGCRTFRAYRRPDMAVLREIRELTPGSLGNLADEAAVLAVARAAGGNPGYAVTDYETDADGRTVATVDPRGVRSTVAYDAAGRVVSRTAAAGLPEQQVFSTTYDGSGRPVAQSDPSGRVTRRTYTPAGRVASVVYPDHASESFRYFADGRLAERTDAAGFTFRQYYTPCCARDFASVGPKGEGALKFYDGLGRVTYSALVKNVDAVKDFGPNLPADAVVSAQTMKYDARGRLVASTKWLVVPASVDPKNAPIATDAAQGLTTTYAYFDDLTDARFAPVLAKLAEQGVTLTTGSATVVTNPAGEQSFTVTDGAGDTVASGVFGK